MRVKNIRLSCQISASEQMKSSIYAVELFCHILGFPENKSNYYFVADDPHGIVEISESYWFNMSDVFTLLNEYDHLVYMYGSNEELRKVVRQWYYMYVNPEDGKPVKPEINFKSWMRGLRPTDLETRDEYKVQKAYEQAQASSRVSQTKEELFKLASEQEKQY